MILYSCRHDGDQYRITKFDEDLNPKSSYLCTRQECDCPAGVRPTCRHREMLHAFMERGAVGTGEWLNYDEGGWYEMEMEREGLALDNEGIPQKAIDLINNPDSWITIPGTGPGPHGAEASTADFDSADGGSNPPVVANLAGSCHSELTQPVEPGTSDLQDVAGLVRPLPAKHYPKWRRV